MNKLIKILSTSLLTLSVAFSADDLGAKGRTALQSTAEDQKHHDAHDQEETQRELVRLRVEVVRLRTAAQDQEAMQRELERLKAEVARLRVVADSVAAVTGTDTEAIIKGIRSRNMHEYFMRVKEDAKANLGAYIDRLLAANGNFLNPSVTFYGVTSPLRDDFKAALKAHLDELVLEDKVPLPVSASLRSIMRFAEDIQEAIAQAMSSYLYSLYNVGGDCFLDTAVAVGNNPGQPYDHTLGSFINELIPALFK